MKVLFLIIPLTLTIQILVCWRDSMSVELVRVKETHFFRLLQMCLISGIQSIISFFLSKYHFFITLPHLSFLRIRTTVVYLLVQVLTVFLTCNTFYVQILFQGHVFFFIYQSLSLINSFLIVVQVKVQAYAKWWNENWKESTLKDSWTSFLCNIGFAELMYSSHKAFAKLVPLPVCTHYAYPLRGNEDFTILSARVNNRSISHIYLSV